MFCLKDVSSAMDVIPACFQIVEALLDILVENEDASQEPFAQEPTEFIPLDDSIALRIMESVSDCIEYILEAVEEASTYSKNLFKNTLLLACSRCVGRFLAEVPSGHSGAVMKCLEPLCAAGEALEGAGFLVPGLLQLASE